MSPKIIQLAETEKVMAKLKLKNHPREAIKHATAHMGNTCKQATNWMN